MRGLFRSGLIQKLAQIDDQLVTDLTYTVDIQKSEIERESEKYENILESEKLGVDRPDLFCMSDYTLEQLDGVYDEEDSVSSYDRYPFVEIDPARFKSRDVEKAHDTHAWLGSRAIVGGILPVVPASKVVNSWAESTSQGVIDSSQPSSEDEAIKNIMKLKIKAALDELDLRESEVLRMLFGIGEYENNEMTHVEIGNHLNLTQRRIEQIELRALSKLRNPYIAYRIRDFYQENLSHNH